MKVTITKTILGISLALAIAGCTVIQHSQHRSIHDDARNGDAALVAQDLAENPNDLNLPDDAGLTPLHLAASYCHTNVMALLLDRGAIIDAQAKGGATPLHIAAQEGCVDGVRLLLARGANIKAKDSQGNTPLQRAELWHQDATAQLLSQSEAK